jgi:hypothetical protein
VSDDASTTGGDSILQDADHSRRGFLARGMALLAAFALRLPMPKPLPVAAGTKVEGYPIRFGWIPAGYKHVHTFAGLPEGFGTGDSEVALLFGHSGYKHGAGALFVFVADGQTDPQSLGATAGHAPELIALTTGQGLTTIGYYQAGSTWWHGSEQVWDTTSFHSLTTTLGGVTIGIRGHLQGPAGRRELVRIIESIEILA